MTAYFGNASFRFLRGLARHNERAWFLAHKADYEAAVREPFQRLLGDLQPALAGISEHYRSEPKTVGGSLFRIQRDIPRAELRPHSLRQPRLPVPTRLRQAVPARLHHPFGVALRREGGRTVGRPARINHHRNAVHRHAERPNIEVVMRLTVVPTLDHKGQPRARSGSRPRQEHLGGWQPNPRRERRRLRCHLTPGCIRHRMQCAAQSSSRRHRAQIERRLPHRSTRAREIRRLGIPGEARPLMQHVPRLTISASGSPGRRICE